MSKTLILIIIVSLSAGALGARVFTTIGHAPFEKLSTKEMREHIILERELAIVKSKSEGNYQCCIQPACTMCFMSANKWNNFTAGTCACDDFIAKGEDPCPQCMRGMDDALCESANNNEIICEIEEE